MHWPLNSFFRFGTETPNLRYRLSRTQTVCRWARGETCSGEGYRHLLQEARWHKRRMKNVPKLYTNYRKVHGNFSIKCFSKIIPLCLMNVAQTAPPKSINHQFGKIELTLFKHSNICIGSPSIRNQLPNSSSIITRSLFDHWRCRRKQQSQRERIANSQQVHLPIRTRLVVTHILEMTIQIFRQRIASHAIESNYQNFDESLNLQLFNYSVIVGQLFSTIRFWRNSRRRHSWLSLVTISRKFNSLTNIRLMSHPQRNRFSVWR